jgi:hypothetical protein
LERGVAALQHSSALELTVQYETLDGPAVLYHHPSTWPL